MSKQIRITPAGQLLVEDDPQSQPELASAVAGALRAAFEPSSAEGLLYLASRGLEQQLPPGFVFWRDFARQLFHEFCQFGEQPVELWHEVPTPPDDQLSLLIGDAPPMRGLEYVTVDLLQRLWGELRELAVQRARQHADGPQAYLRGLSPLWHLLGRVTLHLAENKSNPDRPFAFLATYAHRLSSKARLQHLPLGEALKQYAGAKNQTKLAALLEPVRQAATASSLVRELLDTKALFHPQAWTILQAHRLLVDVPRLEACGLVVRVPDWWNAKSPPRPQVQVRIGQQPTDRLGLDGLLDFRVELAFDGQPLTDEERRRILQATEGLVLLRGRWVEVDQQQLQEALAHWGRLEAEHADGVDFIQGMRLLAGATPGTIDDDEGRCADWSRITAGQWLRETLEKIRDPRGVSGCQPGRDLQATLRPYQADGVRWLWFMTRLGLGACLADDMGLGKTIQVIDLLLQLKRESPPSGGGGDLLSPRLPMEWEGEAPAKPDAAPGSAGASPSQLKVPLTALDSIRPPLAKPPPKSEPPSAHTRPSLLVVPASLIGNWRQELERFGPTLRVFYAHRSECSAETLDRVAAQPDRELAGFDLVITTYGLVRQTEWLGQATWRLVILDEAQAIKNASSAQTRAVKKLSATGHVVLTGTPVENHLGDLWSLFDFCSPGLLGSASQFKKFVKLLAQQQDAHAYGSLRRLVRPYILRRMKTDPTVIPDLPDKTEMRAECGLSKQQVVLYERTVGELERRLESADGMARRGLVLSVLMQLKQICNHPAQYLGQPPFAPADSGKFQRLEQICQPIVERQEKTLVFTQFQSLTEPLAEFLASVFGRPGLVLHGGIPVRKRSELVRTFQDDRGPPFFVISVKAGGSGLNLTAASHVIHFDRWWNPAVENQATDRAFRIGQKKNVLVHKFVCRGTVEERIDQMIRDKQQLADQLLSQGGETLLTEMSDDQLLRFVSLDITRATTGE